MTCKFCNFDLCFQCEEPREDELNAEGTAYRCCCDGLGYRPQSLSLAETFMANRSDDDDAEPMELADRHKSGDQMKDVISTGRKRAAKAAPITEGMVCEWAGLLNAGGGVVPIIGCNGNLASDVHHGADKSVLNNVLGVNLHRICSLDHQRWHAMNDKYYGERPPNGEPFLPLPGHIRLMHDPYTKAELADIIANETWWSKRPENRTTEYKKWPKNSVLTNVEQSDTVFMEANNGTEADIT